jgi:opacity protein-like surface antigen
MRKTILTVALCMAAIFASAQNFMVVTTYTAAEEGAEWEMSSLTDNMGIGYNLNDTWTVGLITAGEDSLGDKNYDLFGRYNWNTNTYISVQAPTEEMMDNLTIGIGYSFVVWKGLAVEPNYTMGLKEDDNGDREGTFNLGLAYRF